MQVNAISALDQTISAEWGRIKQGEFFSVAKDGLPRELYISAMEQIYHYTLHNSINQATAAFMTQAEDTSLLKFAYKHALEEAGHEKMVLKDLRSIGYQFDPAKSRPLPATQALIGYLYYVSLKQGAGPRLGYSYWAEDSYGEIAPILDACRRDLGLTDKEMTFFVAHSSIDMKHADEVHEALLAWCDTEEKLAQVLDVARTSLYLTGEVINACAREYLGRPIALAA